MQSSVNLDQEIHVLFTCNGLLASNLWVQEWQPTNAETTISIVLSVLTLHHLWLWESSVRLQLMNPTSEEAHASC